MGLEAVKYGEESVNLRTDDFTKKVLRLLNIDESNQGLMKDLAFAYKCFNIRHDSEDLKDIILITKCVFLDELNAIGALKPDTYDVFDEENNRGWALEVLDKTDM